MKYFVELNGREREVILTERLGKLAVSVDGVEVDLHYDDVDDLGQLLVLSDGRSFGASIEGDTNRIAITIAGHVYDVQIVRTPARRLPARPGSPARRKRRSPPDRRGRWTGTRRRACGA